MQQNKPPTVASMRSPGSSSLIGQNSAEVDPAERAGSTTLLHLCLLDNKWFWSKILRKVDKYSTDLAFGVVYYLRNCDRTSLECDIQALELSVVWNGASRAFIHQWHWWMLSIDFQLWLPADNFYLSYVLELFPLRNQTVGGFGFHVQRTKLSIFSSIWH